MELFALAPDALVVAGVWQDVLVYTFRTLFFLSALLLTVIVLLQEGKGGGLASALGGQGAETFGVSSGGVNKVTLFLAATFLVSGLAHALAFGQPVSKALGEKAGGSTPVLPGGGGTEPPRDGGAAPPKDEGTTPPKDEGAPPPKDG